MIAHDMETPYLRAHSYSPAEAFISSADNGLSRPSTESHETTLASPYLPISAASLHSTPSSSVWAQGY